jgi:dTDP-4-dehydrorhamnose reductase
LNRAVRVIVLGAAGQLGRQLVIRLGASPRWEVVGFDRRQLDICDSRRARELLLDQRADWLINAAALTDVDRCEAQADEADAVNAHAVAELAAICSETKATLVQVSTDYVFDGRSSVPYGEDAPPNPINVYGRSKWLGECFARKAWRYLIVRTAWLFGRGKSNFVETILRQAAAGAPLRVVNDQTGSPSYAPDMAECIERLMSINADGVFHIANSGAATRYELACKAIELANLHVAVQPVETGAYPTPARRASYGVLDCTKYVERTGHRPREWTSALKAYVQDRSGC